LEGHLGQYPLTESVKFTHHSPGELPHPTRSRL